jgi:tRNA1Val (adenine37-N6)-methyltransferase
MGSIFQFKQFAVEQAGCAMKINTDGVLLGALAQADTPQSILDIGTGTGVIALMLAQRFKQAHIEAIDIDLASANAADANFKASPYAGRLLAHPHSFEKYFECYPQKQFDLVVSNPPFYINSLESPGKRTNLAKHSNEGFFESLILSIARHLTIKGSAWLILPVNTSEMVKNIAAQKGLYLQEIISIHSFKSDEAHREIIALGRQQNNTAQTSFIIYDAPKVYSEQYQNTLKDFFTIF